MSRELGPEYASFLELMESLREPIAARCPDFEERRNLWYTLVDSDILDQFRAGRPESARRSAATLIGMDL